MDPRLRRAAREAIGFMPEEEGLALYETAKDGLAFGPALEIGSYCGKSTTYLGAAAREMNGVIFSIDHHRGSEEHQPGEEYFDERLADSATGRIDTLPAFRRQIVAAGIEDVVLALAARSEVLAAAWRVPLGLVFIDGGHTPQAAQDDYEGWAPHLVRGGLLAIHDVFENPAEGGRPPFEIYRRAVDSSAFKEVRALGSLRVLQRVGDGL
ncbi:MAG: class I SAM-dependent methyltransferase [Actinomycetota bacterium]